MWGKKFVQSLCLRKKILQTIGLTAMLPHEWPVNSENSVSFTTFGCFGVIWDIWNEITKSIERFEDLTFRPIDYNALDREFRPGKLLSTEIRRRIVDLYLSREGPREISPTVRLTYAECVASLVIIRGTAHIFPLVEEDEEILLNFPTMF